MQLVSYVLPEPDTVTGMYSISASCLYTTGDKLRTYGMPVQISSAL